MSQFKVIDVKLFRGVICAPSSVESGAPHYLRNANLNQQWKDVTVCETGMCMCSVTQYHFVAVTVPSQTRHNVFFKDPTDV